MLVACGSDPTPTGTTCANPDPTGGTTTLTWENFGQAFMANYCINCHDSQLTLNERNGAPLFHDFDSLEGVLEVPDHIDEQAGWGPKAQNNFMPGAGTNGKCPSMLGGPLDEDCPDPTGDERTNLSLWIACERLRTHCFGSDGNDPPGGCGSGSD
ncbi:MAG TPA: hypothetical protein VH143_09210 [Kofleriaceae bacterium]|nr:hypothetical protein [Kofleriaceae bacterium]